MNFINEKELFIFHNLFDSLIHLDSILRKELNLGKNCMRENLWCYYLSGSHIPSVTLMPGSSSSA